MVVRPWSLLCVGEGDSAAKVGCGSCRWDAELSGSNLSGPRLVLEILRAALARELG